MSLLTVHNNRDVTEISFEGKVRLEDILTANNLMPKKPCGGTGKCGKCAAFLYKDGEEDKETKILTCQGYVEGDAELFIPRSKIVSKIRTEGAMPEYEFNPVSDGYGVAVDIGTTTLVLRIINLNTGEILPAVSIENPQRAIAADVINRIQAAIKGKSKLQQDLIQGTIRVLFEKALKLCEINESDIKSWVITGNTTMLYLYTGRIPLSLTQVPYTADCRFGFVENGVYFPPCFGAYVGADIYTAILASDMVNQEGVNMLIDLGTNGELALYKEGKLTCCATACGPAFEGTGIECGGPATDGAIDHFWVENGEIKYSVIGDAAPTHMCGSAIIDAVAALLKTGHINETGRLDEDYYVTDSIYVSKQDIRQIQLAKSAICAGILTLMSINDVKPGDINKFYVAGGFGAYLNLETAETIGLIPKEIIDNAVVIGNAALSGAILTLLDKNAADELKLDNCECINLAATKEFSDLYIENMIFDI